MNIASIAIVIIFVVTIILTIIRPPLPSKIPFVGGKRISYWLPSSISAFIVAFVFLSPMDALSSIIGTQEYQPFGIVVLFLSLAFMAFTLDATGFLNIVRSKH